MMMMMTMITFYNCPCTDLSTHSILMGLTLGRLDFHDCLFRMAVIVDGKCGVLIMAA